MRLLAVLSATSLCLRARANITEAQEAALTDLTVECAYIPYAAVDDALASFPPASTPVATIMPDDPAGQATIWRIETNNFVFPQTPEGSLSSNATSGHGPSDSDSWWTYSLCTTPDFKPHIFAARPAPKSCRFPTYIDTWSHYIPRFSNMPIECSARQCQLHRDILVSSVSVFISVFSWIH
ncbi:hypothetical protein C8R45DRAFT_1115435 [Mycena sanguinolenta]|nr:hypothetical protein C8R45DRAFT_1115435 [Mycena sanguinolenta]